MSDPPVAAGRVVSRMACLIPAGLTIRACALTTM